MSAAKLFRRGCSQSDVVRKSGVSRQEASAKPTRAAGVEPRLSIIRGGTDGSRLTELGLPTPNLSSGQHNPHSPLEWTSVEEMQKAVEILVELAKGWGKEQSR